MPYVRARMQPVSKEHARERAAANRVALAPGAASPAVRFTRAFDWFRSAAVYAGRRSYRTLSIGEAAHARRGQIAADAARMLQEHADQMDAVVPAAQRRGRRAELRQAYGHAVTDAARMEAARQWFLFMAAQARRGTGEVAARVTAIQDRAAGRLIEWAEEMDADDYGE